MILLFASIVSSAAAATKLKSSDRFARDRAQSRGYITAALPRRSLRRKHGAYGVYDGNHMELSNEKLSISLAKGRGPSFIYRPSPGDSLVRTRPGTVYYYKPEYDDDDTDDESTTTSYETSEENLFELDEYNSNEEYMYANDDYQSWKVTLHSFHGTPGGGSGEGEHRGDDKKGKGKEDPPEETLIPDEPLIPEETPAPEENSEEMLRLDQDKVFHREHSLSSKKVIEKIFDIAKSYHSFPRKH